MVAWQCLSLEIKSNGFMNDDYIYIFLNLLCIWIFMKWVTCIISIIEFNKNEKFPHNAQRNKKGPVGFLES